MTPVATTAASASCTRCPALRVISFTDMLQLCKVGAAGPVKTYCHNRLQLLEQKFNLHVMLNADKEYLAQKVGAATATSTTSARRAAAAARCLHPCSRLRTCVRACYLTTRAAQITYITLLADAAACTDNPSSRECCMLRVRWPRNLHTKQAHMQVDTHVHHSACMHQKHLLRLHQEQAQEGA